MANREDQLIPDDVEVEVKLPAVDNPVSEVKSDKEKTEDKPDAGEQEGIDSLRAQLEQQKQRAAQMEEARRASEAEAARAAEDARKARLEATTFRSEVEDSRLIVLQNSLEAAKSDELAAKHRYATAMREGDWETAAEAQAQLGRTVARIVTLESGEAALRERLEQKRAQMAAMAKQPPRQEQRTEPQDKVAEYTSRLTPRSAEWIKARPEYVTDPQKNARMLGAHYQAVAEGLAPDSDQYFSFLETRLENTEQKKPTQKETSPGSYSAPPSRERGSSPGAANDTIVRLSPEQREAARIAGLSDVEYAKNLVALRRSGRIS